MEMKPTPIWVMILLCPDSQCKLYEMEHMLTPKYHSLDLKCFPSGPGWRLAPCWGQGAVGVWWNCQEVGVSEKRLGHWGCVCVPPSHPLQLGSGYLLSLSPCFLATMRWAALIHCACPLPWCSASSQPKATEAMEISQTVKQSKPPFSVRLFWLRYFSSDRKKLTNKVVRKQNVLFSCSKTPHIFFFFF